MTAPFRLPARDLSEWPPSARRSRGAKAAVQLEKPNNPKKTNQETEMKTTVIGQQWPAHCSIETTKKQ
jgi:hypothetical protein